MAHWFLLVFFRCKCMPKYEAPSPYSYCETDLSAETQYFEYAHMYPQAHEQTLVQVHMHMHQGIT